MKISTSWRFDANVCKKFKVQICKTIRIEFRQTNSKHQIDYIAKQAISIYN